MIPFLPPALTHRPINRQVPPSDQTARTCEPPRFAELVGSKVKLARAITTCAASSQTENCLLLPRLKHRPIPALPPQQNLTNQDPIPPDHPSPQGTTAVTQTKTPNRKIRDTPKLHTSVNLASPLRLSKPLRSIFA